MIDRDNCRTLTGSALSVAQRKPDSVAFEYVYIGSDREILTFSELITKSLCVAAALLNVAKPGERVLLPCFREREFHIGFYACLLAGCIAVPCHSPRIKKKLADYGLGRFAHIAQDSQATVILAPALMMERTADYLMEVDELSGLKLVSLEAAEKTAPLDTDAICCSPDDIAYLQYTSGSTSNPRGVVVTQENIINNLRYLARVGAFDETMVSVNWLPLYHDMGLTLGCTMGVWLNCRTITMSPVLFISRPQIWLQEISSAANVLSGGPNFTYAHCLAKVDDETIRELDLSGWRLAVNGSEPVVAETLFQFVERFGRCGFSLSRFSPSYGMAEATLFVCGVKPGVTPLIRYYDKEALKNNQAVAVVDKRRNSMALVGCGNEFLHNAIAIVDPTTLRVVADGSIGEIWVSSDSAGKGYWKNREKSAEVFNHSLQGYPGHRFFRSGDLGFFDDGELFISGRIKEMIIINGANFYPYDIERLAKTVHRDLEPLMVAAFMQEHEGNDVLELAVECPPRLLREQGAALMENIKTLISAEFQIKLHNIYLLKIGGIPRTTSGKIQRGLCRQLLQKQSLEILDDLRNTRLQEFAVELGDSAW